MEPPLSYRLSYFSGDDPDTETYERWDPLLSGGNGEQWVQGANHFKVVQDSNVIAQRLQASLRPLPTVELVPQFWLFKADSRNNIGGNPALTFLSDDDYGYRGEHDGQVVRLTQLVRARTCGLYRSRARPSRMRSMAMRRTGSAPCFSSATHFESFKNGKTS